jgi:hypothetical protein
MNVEVEIGGSEANTDGRRRITLPTLPFDDPEIETVAFGYLEHEAAHIRYRGGIDHYVIEGQPADDLVGTCLYFKSELHFKLFNCIKDICDEGKLGKEFPGFAANLSRLVTKLVKDGDLARPNENDHAALPVLPVASRGAAAGRDR